MTDDDNGSEDYITMLHDIPWEIPRLPNTIDWAHISTNMRTINEHLNNFYSNTTATTIAFSNFRFNNV